MCGTLSAKDGFFFPDSPPISIRLVGNGNTSYVHFTNTSDGVIHDIAVTGTRDGKKVTEVFIDTILPHKTSSISSDKFLDVLSALDPATKEKPSVIVFLICKDHTKPLQFDVELEH